MDESADERTLSFYLNEMHRKDYLTSIGAYIKCLDASSLDNSSIKRMATERYERNMAYIKDNFENPDTIFKLEYAQEVLKNYIGSK
jgi:cysteine synthase